MGRIRAVQGCVITNPVVVAITSSAQADATRRIVPRKGGAAGQPPSVPLGCGWAFAEIGPSSPNVRLDPYERQKRTVGRPPILDIHECLPAGPELAGSGPSALNLGLQTSGRSARRTRWDQSTAFENFDIIRSKVCIKLRIERDADDDVPK